MKHKISANSKSVTNAGITSDYKQAIAEYIWNGFDAGASRVYIDYEANGLGLLQAYLFQIMDLVSNTILSNLPLDLFLIHKRQKLFSVHQT